MSTQITTSFVNHYRGNVIHLAQQKMSKLRGAVRVQTDVIGKADHFDRIGKAVAQKKTSRHGDTPLMTTPHSRRRVYMDPYEYADLVDNADKIRTLISPASEYAIAGSRAMGRSMDSVIITALGGNAVSVDADDAGSSVALPSAQKIAHGSAGLTVAKLRQAKRILDEADVEDEGRFICISPIGLEDLLGDTNVTSSDFNTIKALVQGDLQTFLGFQFIRSTLLPKSGNIRAAYAWHRDGVGLSVGQDVVVRMGERADKSYSMQVYLSMDIGATRVEEERVVEISYDESA